MDGLHGDAVITINRAERIYRNGRRREIVPIILPTREPLAFHRKLPDYAPTRLVETPGIAARLGFDRVWVKDESNRLGLPAFKILGASWATYRALQQALNERTEQEAGACATLDGFARALDPLRPLTLTCATDGNHGRAVARMARLLDLDAQIFVPDDMAAARRQAIRDEGARITAVDGTYDDAILRAAATADEGCLVISDTSWPGYIDVPRWVIEGYSTIFWEVDDELARRGEDGPTLVVVQIGVGALAAAVVRHFRRAGTVVMGVEPARAACVLASMEAGDLVSIPGPHDSIMSGLNCGLPSAIAWPDVSIGIDLFLAVDDERARTAMRLLAEEGVVAGETGAAGLAGLLAWLERFGGDPAGHRVLLICTEGATDPEAYRRIVGA